jgi:hypothetical protein
VLSCLRDMMTQPDSDSGRRGAPIFLWLANLLAILAVISVGYVGAAYWQEQQYAALPTPAPVLPTHTPRPDVELPVYVGFADEALSPEDGGLYRRSLLHTTLPDYSAFQIREYEVKTGDTLIGIAETFKLKPQTLLFGNYDILFDDPHRLNVGQNLRILPMDGLLYNWAKGDGLNGVATFFKVTPDDIINWPGNNLTPETVGDYSNPNIPEGTVLFVPNGKRDFYSWSVPVISRRDPARARNMGPGACGTISSGATGRGTFVWPTTSRVISGFHYDPSTNHNGIDIGGSLGNAIYAADGGVVVYAGWNDNGYGNLIVIDHGTGWQSLYAHLSSLAVGCGSSVGQGDVIGGLGSTGRSTGPHLHFELMTSSGAKVNPFDYLQ